MPKTIGKQQIIGFGGQMSSGKTTAANMIVPMFYANSTMRQWRVSGFAEALKKRFSETYNISREDMEKWKRKDEPPPGFKKNIREGLQQEGDGARQIKEDVWIEWCFRDKEYSIALEDGRYKNECVAIKKHGGVSVLIWRPDHENAIDHPSETFSGECVKKLLDAGQKWDAPITVQDVPFDWFLVNNGDLNDLESKLCKVVSFVHEHYTNQGIIEHSESA